MTLSTTFQEKFGKELEDLKERLRKSNEPVRQPDNRPHENPSEPNHSDKILPHISEDRKTDWRSPAADGPSQEELMEALHESRADTPLELASSAKTDAAVTQKRRLLAELTELERENRWEDILALAHPIDEKYPLLAEMEMDIQVRRKIGFSLVRTGQHDQALKEFKKIIQAVPDDFMANYSLAYAAYDALYRHRNREIMLTPKERQHLLKRAHSHFQKCCALKPDSVTCFYRRGMLFKEMENKQKKAIPMLEQAVNNWRSLTEEQKKERHQERPKYIKSMYHLASCLLKLSLSSRALELLQQLMKEDETTEFLSPVFKQFALGKTLYQMGRFNDALSHLQTAAAASRHEKKMVPDFVRELTAGCLLMMERPGDALTEIDKIPERSMRAYVRWRRADILVALGRYSEALITLEKGIDKDSISRHKTLLRMARIHYSCGAWEKTESCAKKADHFFRKRFGNELKEAAFILALTLHAKGNHAQAMELMKRLEANGFSCPGFKKAVIQIRKGFTESVTPSENTAH